MSGALSEGYGDFGGRVWLNTAHQGALPLAAAAAAREAVEWKLAPAQLTPERFRAVPARLRGALGRLLNVPPDEVILANSASYGVHLVANAYPWKAGDEVLVMAGDFPSDILPWLAAAERQGIRVHRIRPRGRVVEPDELQAALTPQTKLFCATWVHSFSGYAIDIDAIGRLCRGHGVIFLVNASQGLGTAPLDARTAPIDGLVGAGFKWLCGPYGTGVCWLRTELLRRLERIKAYWLAMQTQESLGGAVGDVQLRERSGAGDFDVFGTANFFNFMPFAAAVEHMLELGIGRVRTHDQTLVSSFVENLPDTCVLLSPRDGPARSNLVFFSHRDAGRNAALHAALRDAGIDVALRNGALRLAPHVYNGSRDIHRALSVIDSFPK